ncbi:MAG TPA: aminopeptidase P family N-terminal domain-containing protein, partial [Vicinamibacterales bacterium]|nr:aminopeptidase P family N-terminal domain-containing protein [Vicinamibacterales bacterium]
MSTRSPNCFLGRRSRTRQDIHAAGLDALVVTHLPNVRYLTGFNGTAGLLVLTEHKCLLVVDFRYAAAARAVAQSEEDPSAVSVVVAQRSYDET